MKLTKDFLQKYYLELLLFSALIVIVGFLDYKILYPHLLYGFADVDWGFLLRFKTLPPFSVNQVISEWQASGVYAYQTYYIGIQSVFFGVDYFKFHFVTNLFKFLSTITLFPLLLYLSKNKTVSFIATIIYAVAYPSIGAIYTVVTSGIYFAVFVMNICLLIYAYTESNVKSSKWWFLVIAALYYLALFFSTERLYPLIPLLVLAELFMLWRRKFPGPEIKRALIRLFIILAPLLIAIIYRPYAQNNAQFFNNTWLLYEKILNGNWHLLLVPFTVLGSLFIPRDYWRYFGIVDVSNFNRYHDFYLFNPFLVFLALAVIFAILVSKRPLLFIIATLLPTYILGIVSFFLVVNRLSAPESLRMHYDPNIYLMPALFGEFILCLSLAFAIEWIRGKFENRIVFAMFFAPVAAFFFIFSTWLPAEPGLVFSNVHRYLTIPAISSSLFMSGTIWLIFKKMRQYKFLKHPAFLVFLLLFPIIVINAQVLSEYFKNELDFAGMRGSEHLRMKSKFVSYLEDDFTTGEPALFFVDASGDQANGYFHETTIMAGFDFWMMFRNRPEPDIGVYPTLVRNDFFCPEGNCTDKFRALVSGKDGKSGILYKDVFYPSNRVYAYRIINRDVTSIKDKFHRDLGLEE